MADQFPKFINRLLGHEGGYVNDPKDPGGETKFGISKRTYPTLDIKNLTRDQAVAIYRRDFWDAAGMGLLSPVIGFQMLDGAVNSGIDRATRWLQTAARVTADGKIGPVTRAAVEAADQNDLVLRFLGTRLQFMTDLSTWDRFGRGWARRIATNLMLAADDN